MLDSINEALRRDADTRQVTDNGEGFAERLAALTERERDILEHVVQGLSSKSIARVLEIDLQKLALANADKEYAFRVIDHAQVPKRKWVEHPHRVLIVLGAFLLGVMGSGAFVIARDGVRRRRVLRAELRPPT